MQFASPTMNAERKRCAKRPSIPSSARMLSKALTGQRSSTFVP